MKEPMTRNELENHCDVLGAVSIDWPVRMSLSRTIRDHDAALRAKVKELERELAQCEKLKEGYRMDALVKFDCQVCSGALEDENDRLRARIKELEHP